MDDRLLARIADALDRLAPVPLPSEADARAPAYRYTSGRLRIAPVEPVPLALLRAIDAQKAAVLANLRRLAHGHAAHDMLLWGARGSGKSALVKAAVRAVQDEGLPLTLVELSSDALADLPDALAYLPWRETRTLLFIDDLSFDADMGAARQLRSLLDGGATARTAGVRLAVTSNRRHIVARDMAEQDSAINIRDVVDDRLALADRFGLSLGFHLPDQDQWLTMVESYATAFGLPFDRAAALQFAATRGTRSGRTAWHYTVEVAGAAGMALEDALAQATVAQ